MNFFFFNFWRPRFFLFFYTRTLTEKKKKSVAYCAVCCSPSAWLEALVAFLTHMSCLQGLKNVKCSSKKKKKKTVCISLLWLISRILLTATIWLNSWWCICEPLLLVFSLVNTWEAVYSLKVYRCKSSIFNNLCY